MRSRIRWTRAAASYLTVIVAAATFGIAPNSPAEGGGVGQIGRQTEPVDTPGPEAAWNAKRLRALNADRHKSMASDAERLLKLARQLDAEVASNPTGRPTAEEMRKVAEIEKLARSVKSKMALSFSGGPQLRGPTTPLGGLEGPRLQ